MGARLWRRSRCGRRALRIGIAFAFAASLSGCAVQAVRETPPTSADATALERGQREQWLMRHPHWSFVGRAAIRKGDRGGSGRIEWNQDDDRRYTVALSAPVTRQSWRLIGNSQAGSWRIEGLEGGPRASDDAQALLLETTGWDIPVEALASWVRGLDAPGHPVEAREDDAKGRPRTIKQLGWTIRYTEWRPGEDGRPQMPAKIEAAREDAGVRLAIDRWDFSSP